MRGKKAKELRRKARLESQPSELMAYKYMKNIVNQKGVKEQRLKAYQLFWRGFRSNYQDMKRGTV